MRLKYRIDEFKSKIFRKIAKYFVLKSYPYWDYSYLYQLMADWSLHASKKTKENQWYTMADNVSKDLLIFSEFCSRVANDSAFDHGTKLLDGSFYLDGKYSSEWRKEGDYHVHEVNTKLPNGLRKHINNKEQKLREFYLQNIANMIIKKSLGWWE